MNKTNTFWLAAGALLLAAVAAALALVAVVRAGDSVSTGDVTRLVANESSTGGMPGATSMSGSSAQMSAHMAAAPTKGVKDATVPTGGQPLAHAVDGDTWVFRLTTKPVRWEIAPGTRVTAWTYDGTVPGPAIRVPYGQKVRVIVKNELPEATTVHWHGIDVPYSMDGVPGVTQKAIPVGGTFTYSFRAVPAGGGTGGTFMYHSHADEDRQVGLGLSAPFVIVPPEGPSYAVDRTIMIGEWNLDPTTGATRPPMEMEGVLPNYFTLNGKSYPATEPVNVKPGARVLLRLVGAGQFAHPMHLHGTAFTVIAKDGHALSSTYKADVINVAPGERYDITFAAPPSGKWVFHCHIGHHLTNNGESPGGLLMVVNTTGKAMTAAADSTGSSSNMSTDSSTGGGPASTHTTTGDMPGMDMPGTGSP